MQVGGSGCAIRGGGGTLKIRSQYQEEEDKESGRTGGKKKYNKQDNWIEVEDIGESWSEV